MGLDRPPAAAAASSTLLHHPAHVLAFAVTGGCNSEALRENGPRRPPRDRRALRATRKAAHADSNIAAAPVKASSISRYRRKIEPQRIGSTPRLASSSVPRMKGMVDMRRIR